MSGALMPASGMTKVGSIAVILVIAVGAVWLTNNWTWLNGMVTKKVTV
jgi:hypothetical protein